MDLTEILQEYCCKDIISIILDYKRWMEYEDFIQSMDNDWYKISRSNEIELFESEFSKFCNS